MRNQLILIIAFILLSLSQLTYADEAWVDLPHSKLRLISAGTDGDHYLIGLEFALDDGWKLYALDPNNVGAEPQLDWSDVTNLQAQHIKWPIAEDATDELGNKSATYQHQVILPIFLNSINPHLPIKGKLQLRYALCNQMCIPVQTTLDISVDQNFSNHGNQHKIESYLQVRQTSSLWMILLVAFMGGVILNIMPCVLPILSIKIFTLLSQRNNQPKRSVRLNLLSTSAGIIFSFFLLAAFTVSMQFFGHQIGFGMHFQQPVFIITLILILIFFACNLMGEFELNLPSKINDLVLRTGPKNQLLSCFLSGSFATIMATPCSAPLVGTAVSFALSSSYLEVFSIFITMGLGMASPFLLLSIFPSAVMLLPKPGMWMIYVKKFLGILLFLTVLWLLYVLAAQIGILPSVILFLLALLIKFFLSTSNRVKLIIIPILLIFSYALPLTLQNQQNRNEQFVSDVWQPLALDKIAELVNQDRIVLVDIGANWCLTCKINKLIVLNQLVVLNYFEEHHIIAMRSDITSANPIILQFMQKHHRHGIPFTIIFSKKHPQGLLLPEILTVNKLINALRSA